MEAGAAADSPFTGLITTQAGAAAAGQAVGKADGQALDFELPLTAVVRILKRKLPEGVAVSKEAKVAFAKSAGMFILYITAAANEYCKDARRSSMSARDIFEALRALQFDELIPPLERFLQETREQVALVAQPAKKKLKASSASDAGDAAPVLAAKRGRPLGSGKKKSGAAEVASESAAAIAASPSVSPSPSPSPVAALKDGGEEEDDDVEEEELEQDEEIAAAEEEEEEDEEETGAAAERGGDEDE